MEFLGNLDRYCWGLILGSFTSLNLDTLSWKMLCLVRCWRISESNGLNCCCFEGLGLTIALPSNSIFARSFILMVSLLLSFLRMILKLLWRMLARTYSGLEKVCWTVFSQSVCEIRVLLRVTAGEVAEDVDVGFLMGLF